MEAGWSEEEPLNPHILPIAGGILSLLGIWKRIFLHGGCILIISYLLLRGLSSGRLPVVGPHDTLNLLGASTVLMAIPFMVLTDVRKNTLFFRLLSLMSGSFILSSLLFRPHDGAIPPVLRTFWFEIHVVSAFLSYGLFGIGAIFGIDFLLKKDMRSLDLKYRSILTGYTLFSFSMITGGIWAFYAWGTYWLWTPKELWTVILWLFYGLYLHMRVSKRWNNLMAIAGITGFGVVLFTYLGVSLLMKSSHSF